MELEPRKDRDDRNNRDDMDDMDHRDDFERELHAALARRPAPADLKRKIVGRLWQQAGRSHRRMVWMERIAASLVIAAVAGGATYWRARSRAAPRRRGKATGLHRAAHRRHRATGGERAAHEGQPGCAVTSREPEATLTARNVSHEPEKTKRKVEPGELSMKSPLFLIAFGVVTFLSPAWAQQPAPQPSPLPMPAPSKRNWPRALREPPRSPSIKTCSPTRAQ